MKLCIDSTTAKKALKDVAATATSLLREATPVSTCIKIVVTDGTVRFSAFNGTIGCSRTRPATHTTPGECVVAAAPLWAVMSSVEAKTVTMKLTKGRLAVTFERDDDPHTPSYNLHTFDTTAWPLLTPLPVGTETVALPGATISRIIEEHLPLATKLRGTEFAFSHNEIRFTTVCDAQARTVLSVHDIEFPGSDRNTQKVVVPYDGLKPIMQFVSSTRPATFSWTESQLRVNDGPDELIVMLTAATYPQLDLFSKQTGWSVFDRSALLATLREATLLPEPNKPEAQIRMTINGVTLTIIASNETYGDATATINKQHAGEPDDTNCLGAWFISAVNQCPTTNVAIILSTPDKQHIRVGSVTDTGEISREYQYVQSPHLRPRTKPV